MSVWAFWARVGTDEMIKRSAAIVACLLFSALMHPAGAQPAPAGTPETIAGPQGTSFKFAPPTGLCRVDPRQHKEIFDGITAANESVTLGLWIGCAELATVKAGRNTSLKRWLILSMLRGPGGSTDPVQNMTREDAVSRWAEGLAKVSKQDPATAQALDKTKDRLRALQGAKLRANEIRFAGRDSMAAYVAQLTDVDQAGETVTGATVTAMTLVRNYRFGVSLHELHVGAERFPDLYDGVREAAHGLVRLSDQAPPK